jgi:hypothetical protein
MVFNIKSINIHYGNNNQIDITSIKNTVGLKVGKDLRLLLQLNLSP